MATTTDPTMQLIADLDDPSKYVRRDRVAVFKPHKRIAKVGEGKEVTIEVDRDDLEEIAENLNHDYQSDGQLVKLVIGHRKQHPDFPETNQPPVVGYAKNHKAEVVQRPGGPAVRLTQTEYIRRDSPYAQRILSGDFPERSPEYDPESKSFGAVALLTRDQWLKLGTVSYQADGSVYYALGGNGMDENLDTEVVKQEDDWTPEDDVAYAKHCKYMKKYEAEAMGAGNGTMPATEGTPPLPYAKGKPTVDYAASVDARVQRAEQARQAAEKTVIMERSQRALDKAATQVKFDRDRELNVMVNYCKNDTERKAHIDYMLATYAPLPEAGSWIEPSESIPYQQERGTPEVYRAPSGYEAIIQYMKAHPGMSYDQAAIEYKR